MIKWYNMKKFMVLLLLLLVEIGYSQETPIPVFGEALNNFLNVRDFALSKDGDEAYVTVQSPLGEKSQIIRLVREGAKWNNPELVSFSSAFNDLEPFLSPDGLRLYFASNRPINSNGFVEKDYDIWYVERVTKETSWSLAKNIGTPINTSKNEFYPSVALNGNMYFTSDWDGGKGKDDIYFSEFKNGKYQAPVSLPKQINTDGYEFNAFISADDTKLFFTAYRRADGIGSGDLYMAKKDQNKQWQEAVNLGPKINSTAMDYCPYLDEQNNVLYFTSKRSGIKAKKEFSNLAEYEAYLNQSENGLSKLYKVPYLLE